MHESYETNSVGNTVTAPLQPPGWYPDPGDANTKRYFDGTKWTDQLAPFYPPLQLKGPAKSQRPSRIMAIAGIGVLCIVIVAFAIFGVVALVRENHRPTQASPTTSTHSASAPAPESPAPQAARNDDDEFVALAISPRAIDTPHIGGWGTAGTQDRANQIALSECRAASGNDDCLLVNAGMFHGCVSYAIDISRRAWASGFGVDSESARADARSRLGTPASFVYAQCSDPPGVVR
jgi:hypothetical protein